MATKISPVGVQQYCCAGSEDIEILPINGVNPTSNINRAEVAKMMSTVGKISSDANTKKNNDESGQAMMDLLNKISGPVTGGLKRLKGLISQVGTADPTVIILENSFKGEIEVRRLGAGDYIFESLGSAEEPVGEFAGNVVTYLGDTLTAAGNKPFFDAAEMDSSSFMIIAPGGDGTMTKLPFVIEVYNPSRKILGSSPRGYSKLIV